MIPPLPGSGAEGLAQEVAGHDDRKPVADPSAYPQVCIAAVFSRMRRDPTVPAPFAYLKRGTAFLVGPRMLLTAAHVVFDPATFGPAREGFANFVGILLASADGMRSPFGEVWTSACPVFPDYIRTRRPEDDVAALLLERPLLQRWIVPRTLPDAALLEQPVEVTGYDPVRGAQFCTAMDRIRRLDAARVYHQADTESGQSGSPVLLRERAPDGSAIAVAVHGSAFMLTPPPIRNELLNSGPRFRPEVMSWLAGLGGLGW